VSRGDDSGTHKKSLEIWRSAGVDVALFSGKWYREAGAGMGATLNIAVSVGGYSLTDRATWEKFGNKGDLVILSEGDPTLRNQYGIVMVNPAVHGHVKKQDAAAFINWVVSEKGQTAIDRYTVNGKQVFFANAGRED
jgi:tungstate transport system substrate-binding protein